MNVRGDWRRRSRLTGTDWQILLSSAFIILITAVALTTLGRNLDPGSDDVSCPPTWKPARVILDRQADLPGGSVSSREIGRTDQGLDADLLVGAPEVGSAAPTTSHPLGTDPIGHDIVRGILVGSRNIFLPGLLAATVALCLGATLALVEGFGAHAWIREVAGTIRLVIGSMPRFIVLLVVLAAAGRPMGPWAFGLAVGVMGAVRVAELLRSQIEVLRQSDFIEACREMGTSRRDIVVRHVLKGSAVGLLLSQFTYGLSEAILLETMLGVVNWSIYSYAVASWPAMLATGFRLIPGGMLWTAIPPLLAIMFVIVGLYVLSKSLTQKYFLSRIES